MLELLLLAMLAELISLGAGLLGTSTAEVGSDVKSIGSPSHATALSFPLCDAEAFLFI